MSWPGSAVAVRRVVDNSSTLNGAEDVAEVIGARCAIVGDVGTLEYFASTHYFFRQFCHLLKRKVLIYIT